MGMGMSGVGNVGRTTSVGTRVGGGVEVGMGVGVSATGSRAVAAVVFGSRVAIWKGALNGGVGVAGGVAMQETSRIPVAAYCMIRNEFIVELLRFFIFSEDFGNIG